MGGLQCDARMAKTANFHTKFVAALLKTSATAWVESEYSSRKRDANKIESS